MILASSWFVLTSIRRLWRRFWHDSHALPRIVWLHWSRSLIAGFICTAILTFAITIVTQRLADQELQAWDEQMLRTLVATIPMSFAQAITWQSPGNLIGMLPVVLTSTAIAAWRSRPVVAASLFLAYLLQFAFAWIGWGLWDRSRPDIVADGLAAPGLHSFPSGHVLVVITIYGLLTYLWFRATRSLTERLFAILLFVVWAGLVCVSRLVLGAHWVSDILAGLLIAGLWLCSLIYALNRAETAIARFANRQ